MVAIQTDQIFEDIVETIREPLLVLDSDLRVISANRSFYDSFKVTPEETVGQLVYDLGNKQWDIPKLRELLENILPEKTTFNNYEVEHEFASIGRRTMLLNARQIERGAGKERIILLAIEDITEHKRLEDLLADSEELYRRLFETADDGILLLEKHELKIRHANPGITATLGYSSEDCIGNDLKDIGFPEDIGTVNGIMQTLNDDGIIYFKDVAVQKKDGQVIDADIYMVDRASLVQCNIRDITKGKQAGEDLAKLQAQLSDAMEMARLGHWEYDVINDIFTFNDHFYKIFRTTAEQVGGYTMSSDEYVSRFIHPDEMRVVEEENRKAIETTDPNFSRQLEHRILHGDGTEGHISVQFFIVKDAHGRTVKTYGVNQDITERKQAETELQQSEERFRAIAINTPDHILIQDKDLRYVAVINPQLGLTEEDMIGKTDFDFLSKEDAAALTEIKRKVLRTGNPEFVKVPLLSLDGDVQYFEGSYIPKHDQEGKNDGLIGYFRNVTERIKSEEALEENEQRYKKAQRIGHVGNWEYELKTESFWASDQAKRIYGFDPKSKKFTTDEVERCIPERERVHQALIDLIEQNKPYDLEFEIRPVSGPPQRTIKSIAEILFDENGVPQKVVGVIHDITMQKKAEKEKIHLERQLQQSQKLESIGNLAGGIAHDFNNILSSIIGFTELSLDDVEKGTNIEDNLQEVYAAGKRAKDLVKQILAFARQSDEKYKPIQVVLIVKEVLQFIRSSIPSTVEIRQNIESESLIMGNSTQVYQVLMNLCTNAAQVMEDKGGILEVSLKDITIDRSTNWKPLDIKFGDYIEIKVSDTGTGIQPEIIKHIFEPYFTTKAPGEGSGMGLAMSHGIVDSYGGKIMVDSIMGKGTVFTIYLPITRKRGDHRAYESEELPSGTERILFVDDEAPIAKMGSQVLERLGYKVTTRTSSVEALELFRSKPNDFDLIVTDMTMPNMTGDKLAVELMKIRQDIPVILCTGYSKKLSDENAAEFGIKAFSYKPIVKADLSKTVRKVLDEAQRPH